MPRSLSRIAKVSVNDGMKPIIDNNYSKDQVYAVTFNHTETDSSGNLVVYVALDQDTVVGKSEIMSFDSK